MVSSSYGGFDIFGGFDNKRIFVFNPRRYAKHTLCFLVSLAATFGTYIAKKVRFLFMAKVMFFIGLALSLYTPLSFYRLER
jgi:hypothetical protein